MQVMASDADDPTYGSSARIVYSVLEGEQHFTVDSKTGEQHPGSCRGPHPGGTTHVCAVSSRLSVGMGSSAGGRLQLPDLHPPHLHQLHSGCTHGHVKSGKGLSTTRGALPKATLLSLGL